MTKNNFVEKKLGDIYLSESDIEILERYEIDYKKYTSMKELLFSIQDILNNHYVEADLEELLIKLTEYNYYFKTNK